METVHNVAEAEAFFASNAGVEVICENEDKVTKVVGSFAEAEAFFTEGEGESEATGTEANAGDTVVDATGTDADVAEAVGEASGTGQTDAVDENQG